MRSRRKRPKEHRTAVTNVSIQHLRPTLDQQFGGIWADNDPAERRNTLAILKIVELIVAGRIPQRAGEDYFVTACRLIADGPSGVQISAAARRALDKALAEVKRSDPRAMPNMVEMRAWRGRRALTRTILLLTLVEKVIGSRELTKWLERSNPNLGRRAPVDLMRSGDWSILSDFLDDMLTGSTT